MNKDEIWDILQILVDKANELLVQKIAPTEENEYIRKEIILARSHIIRAQALT